MDVCNIFDNKIRKSIQINTRGKLINTKKSKYK